MRYTVYLIVSFTLQKKLISYVGYCKNLDLRLSLHNQSKGAKFTRGRKWFLAYSKKYKKRNVAMKEEYKLKKDIKKRNKIKYSFLTKKTKSNN